jgi:hypothetical protein
MRVCIRHKALLVLLLGVFVVLTPTMYFFFLYMTHGLLTGPTTFMCAFWFGIPGSIFGKPLFEDTMFGIMRPHDDVGWLVTVLFWTGTSVTLWLATLLFRRKATHSSSASHG